MEMSTEDAARRLGAHPSEVVKVEDTEHGTVATTLDGWRYLIRDGQPLAFYGQGPTHTDFPVFVPPPEPEEPAVDTDGDGVPDGTTKQILEWVAEDPSRAALALAAERDKGDDARTTLVRDLEKLVG
jgi:hypothetical protein